MRKKALITGITGQDGAYLAEFLLEKGYEVHGLQRRTSFPNTFRLETLLGGDFAQKIALHTGDLSDAESLFHILKTVEPDEIYNLGAQSDVAASFESPESTADINGLGVLRLLEAIRVLELEKKTRFYQASTSELFGLVRESPQRETTPFYPRSPYATAKLYAYWIAINYREAYGMFACNGILFNHESSLRGENFVTRKITRTLTKILLGREKKLYLGNLDALRDWGYTRDFIEMEWLILQQKHPEDYVIATGIQHSVREFVNLAAEELGIRLDWEGEGIHEKGIIASIDGAYNSLKPGMTIIAVDPKYFRPAEVSTLLGDPTKAAQKLGWRPKVSFEEMVAEMVREDLLLAQKEMAYASTLC